MNQHQAQRFISTTLIVLFTFIFHACNQGTTETIEQYGNDSLAIRKAHASSPVLTPEESMKTMKLEEGFNIKLVAAEPLVIAPVALSFDERGRMWVIEMESYMPDTIATGEEEPKSRISILEDNNGDGIMDSRKVFMNGLILPRTH